MAEVEGYHRQTPKGVRELNTSPCRSGTSIKARMSDNGQSNSIESWDDSYGNAVI